MSQISFLGLSFIFMSKNGKMLVIFSHFIFYMSLEQIQEWELNTPIVIIIRDVKYGPYSQKMYTFQILLSYLKI